MFGAPPKAGALIRDSGAGGVVPVRSPARTDLPRSGLRIEYLI